MAIFGLLLLACISTISASSTDYHNWADAGLQSYLLRFWSQKQNYILSSTTSQSSTGYWTFAQGLDAVIDGVERTHAEQYYGWIGTFYQAQNPAGFYRDWYDDENWMALALLRAHDQALLVGDTQAASTYLATSTSLLQDIAKAWDTTCCGSIKGGLWWDKAHTQKATAANAGAVITAARMYQKTQTSQYLQWALQWYEFWLAHAVSSTGQVADHIDSSGNLVWWKFTYNNALMVGAAVELYKATGKTQYLSDALKFATFMSTDMTASDSYGPVLTDGSNSGCTGDCQQFKGPSYRYLIEYRAADPTGSAKIAPLLQASAESIWNTARDASRNLFATDWTAGISSSAVVTDASQNSACQALSQWAESSGPYPGTGYPQGQIEAENGQLINLGLESSNGGFTGWGYVAGWGGSGQGVTIRYQVSASSYAVSFRYGSVEQASRTITVDGRVIEQSQSFPSTNGYGTYQSVTLGQSLTGTGWHTMTIMFNSGNSGYINLDHVLIQGK